jgi:hypothetical protein
VVVKVTKPVAEVTEPPPRRGGGHQGKSSRILEKGAVAGAVANTVAAEVAPMAPEVGLQSASTSGS